MHKRSELRNAIFENLQKSGVESFNQRYYPLQIKSDAYALIYTHSTETEYISTSYPRSRQNTLNLTVEIVASGQDLDDKIDIACEKIEAAITANDGMQISLLSATVQTDIAGEKPIAVMLQQWEVIYLDKE